MDEFNKELCDERHGLIGKALTALFGKHDELSKCVSTKFNQILVAIMVTLLTVVGSLITIIVTRK